MSRRRPVAGRSGAGATSAHVAASYLVVRLPRPGRARLLGAGPSRAGVAVAVALAGVVVCGAATVPSAMAQEVGPTVEEYGLEVAVGFGGAVRQLAWTPVEVRIAPSRPLRATLTVDVAPQAGGTALREVASVEVGGGSAKAYRFVVPPGAVTVTVAEPDRPPLRTPTRPQRSSGFVVGRLEDDVDGLPALRNDALALGGTWVPIDAEWLALPRALDPLDGLVVDAAAAADLPEGSRRALATEVAAGLDLVLTSAAGEVDAEALGLPTSLAAAIGADGDVQPDDETAAWQVRAGDVGAGGGRGTGPVVAVTALAGRGRVTVTSQRPDADGGAVAARLWSTLLGPRGPLREAASTGGLAAAPFRLAELFATGGGAAPRIPWLLAFLVAYVAVVGPLNAFVLARARRREYAWVTVPLVTVVFTAAGFAAAAGGSSEAAFAGRAVWWLDGAGREQIVASVRASSDGSRSLEVAGSAWAVRPLSDAAPTAAVARGDAVRVDLELRALQTAGVLAVRPVQEPPPLEVTATSEGRGVRVHVRNTSADPVEGVEVRAATARLQVGTLVGGAEADVLVDLASLPTVDAYAWEQSSVAPPPPGRGRGPEAFELLLRSDVLDGTPGTAWAVGRRPGGLPVVEADGRPATSRGTFLAVGTRILPDAAGLVGPFAVDRAALPADVDLPRGPLHVDGASEVVMRFRLPPGADAPILADDLQRSEFGGNAHLDAWSDEDGVWLPFDGVYPAGEGDPARVLSPVGDLYVRATGELFPFETSGRGVATFPRGTG